MMYFKLGVRNLFRNHRRTILSALAIGLGLASLIITDGFILGITQNMIKTATSNLMGQAQIHSVKYKENNEVEFTINEFKSLAETLNNNKQVEGWAERVSAQAMIASANDSKNINLYGILPEKERSVTAIHKYIVEGEYLPQSEQRSVLLGTKLASDLGVELGGKVVLTVSNFETGDLSQELFRVVGIVSFGSKQMDQRLAFTRLSDAQQLLGLGSGVHEVVLNLGSEEIAGDNSLPLWKQLSVSGNIAEGWRNIMPSLSAMLEMTSYSTLIISIILMVLVGLGIVNTLFMSIFERLFEFGVLRAVGTESLGVFLMIEFEAIALGILSSVFGIVIAIILGGWMATSGLDYGGVEIGAVTFREPVYYIFKLRQYTWFPLATILFTALVGLYPAYFATKITLSKAMKKSL